VLIAALLLHIAGALKHHFVDRDATLRRMLPGMPTLPALPAQHHSAVPVLTALVLWVAVLVGGTIMGRNDTGAAEVAELTEVTSDWTVQTGSIEITVVQFGSAVTGSFADWTASITFDEDDPQMTIGSVTTTIAIPSLTLGSVTDQAMGADFFDAATYPTAVFDAVLNRANDGFEAAGTLTIRDQSMPLTLPFSLSIVEGLAEMKGALTLDRRDFGVGSNMNDASSLAFEVNVDVTLTATRATPE
jgi:polyisoprenoid-binding protein YceI